MHVPASTRVLRLASRLSEGLTRLESRLGTRRWRPVWIMGLSFFATFSFYRMLLWRRLFESDQPPWGFVPTRFWWHEYIAASLWDVLTAALLALPFVLVFHEGSGRLTGALKWAVGLACSLAVALSCAVHLRMTLDRGESLGVALMGEALGGAMTLREAWSYGDLGDHSLVLFPMLVVPLGAAWALGSSGRAWRCMLRGAWGVVGLLALMALLPAHDRFARRFHHNPLQYAVGEIARTVWRGTPEQARLSRPVSQAQQQRLLLIEEEFVHPEPRQVPSSTSLPQAPRPWNVVIVVAESTAAEAVFSRTQDGSMAMPFLHELSEESWWMSSHYTTANTSHRSLFSIFTGLYPSFGEAYFVLTADIDVPTLSTYLPEDHARFLVTPGDLRSYFPRRVLSKSGFDDMSGRAELLERSRRQPTRTALHELDAVEAFERRLRSEKGPFLGVYYSYTPHYNYRDFGPDYRPMSDTKNRRHRYINNLRFLDTVIARFVEELKTLGKWEQTVFIVVGDHGEAFGQHEFFTHGNHLYEEQIRTPWLMHFPGATPRVVEEPTSHVDIVPTLLDTLGLSQDAAEFQGESLWDPVRRRRYVFSVDNQRRFSSVAQDRTKVISNFPEDNCSVFDLRLDPQEHHANRCETRREQAQALFDFRLFQSGILQRVSARRRSTVRSRAN